MLTPETVTTIFRLINFRLQHESILFYLLIDHFHCHHFLDGDCVISLQIGYWATKKTSEKTSKVTVCDRKMFPQLFGLIKVIKT